MACGTYQRFPPLPIRHSKINLAHPGPMQGVFGDTPARIPEEEPASLGGRGEASQSPSSPLRRIPYPPPGQTPQLLAWERSFVPCGCLCGWRCAVIGREKSVGVGGLEADEVEHYIYHLRNQWGLKSRRLGAGQIISQRRSVQGVWNPFVKYD